jgi:CheY-like chemotaxis protein
MILIVEDAPAILLALRETLEADGFTCLTAGSGKLGAHLIARHAAQAQALVTDIRIGEGIDGWELGHRARQHHPSIPIVYITGDSAHEWRTKGVVGSVVLQKPFCAAKLLAALTKLATMSRSSRGGDARNVPPVSRIANIDRKQLTL